MISISFIPKVILWCCCRPVDSRWLGAGRSESNRWVAIRLGNNCRGWRGCSTWTPTWGTCASVGHLTTLAFRNPHGVALDVCSLTLPFRSIVSFFRSFVHRKRRKGCFIHPLNQSNNHTNKTELTPLIKDLVHQTLSNIFFYLLKIKILHSMNVLLTSLKKNQQKCFHFLFLILTNPYYMVRLR